MREQIYEIPINDAFAVDCECPICTLYKTLEDDAVEYTMGPSYMEDDTRAKTDAAGFCEKHIHMIYHQDNRLGMAWVMKTHFDKIIRDVEKLTPRDPSKLLKKELASSKLVNYLDTLNDNCFICNRINDFFGRYIDTVFTLYKTSDEFRDRFRACKGFCNPHYALLLKLSPKYLRGSELEDFVSLINRMYIENMERVRDDLAWFINKFDYKYQDEPWKNAKDAIPRSVIKTNATFIST